MNDDWLYAKELPRSKLNEKLSLTLGVAGVIELLSVQFLRDEERRGELERRSSRLTITRLELSLNMAHQDIRFLQPANQFLLDHLRRCEIGPVIGDQCLFGILISHRFSTERSQSGH